MESTTVRSMIGVAIALALAAGVGWALSHGTASVGGVSVVVLAMAVAFVISWVAFVPAFLGQTERFYDLTGTLSYLAAAGVAVVLAGRVDLRAGLALALAAIWTLRLGIFLFRRVQADGGDGRFDDIKKHGPRFFLTWTLQGLWVSLTSAAALVIFTADERAPMEWIGWLGVALWVFGFGYEVVADQQKRIVRADPANRGRWIDTGLWRLSRHPNYFGEIVLWAGMFVLTIPVLGGWRWVAAISPVFVHLLLTKVSGVPLLTKRAIAKWGDDPDFQRYMQTTPAFVPLPRRG